MIRSITVCMAVLLLCITYNSYSQQNEGVIISSSAGGYDVQYNLPDYSTSAVTRESEQYIVLNIASYGITSAEGLPMLPQISFNLILNTSETTPGYEISSRSTEEKFLSSKIFPAQAPWEKSKDLKDRPFTINRDYYATSGSINSPLVTFSEPFIIAGVKAVTVTITPFNYDPQANRLVLTKTARIKINLSKGLPYYSAVPESFRELFNPLFINSGVLSYTPTNNYLIITSPDFESTMAPFASYKSSMGYNVLMVNTGTTGTTNTAILNYIQNRYNNINTRPEFILLVGDIDRIPEWTGIGSDNPHTDLNYTLLEGNDAFADAFIGRFPVASTAQLTNIINKSIFMEGSIGSLTKKSIFMASNDNYTISEGTHNFVIDSFFNPQGYTNLKLYVHTYGATTQQLIDALNANQVYAIYSGHGSQTSWADGPPLNQSQVNALTNTWFPFVYSFACLTGQFQQSECFGETWIRSPKAGSVFWGSSVNSFWDEDDILERRLYRAKFTDGLKKTAPMFVMGKYYLVQYYGSVTTTMRRYLEMYNCFGDPSIYQAPFGPIIAHNQLPNTENLNGPYAVNCSITPAGSAIDPSRTRLFWSRNNPSITDSVQMTNTGGNNWTANIPGNGTQATYRYYIKTADALNRISIAPPGAPGSLYSFNAAQDLQKPQIVHTQIPDCPKNQWPALAAATVTDNLGIDSVWVRWYKNNPGTGIKHFKLLNTGGSNFQALFNSDSSQVAYNDEIYYRVFAQDNSQAHNRDSTALYNFTIIAQATACIGTGSTAAGYPFYTYYHDSRTQMLYTAAEVLAGGGAPGMITKIGFNVTSSAPQVMSGFNIRMQLTSASGISGFVSSGWTTVYTGTYSVPGTGWQYIELQNAFYYNCSQNLMIEICFDNTSYTSNTMVNSTSAAGMTWHHHVDGGTGCTLTGGSAQSTRPNVCLKMNLLVGNNNNSTKIPDVFSLEQNYPNPFNPVTKITYSVPKQSFVTIKIYDIIGREVTTLVNGVNPAGYYEVEWNAMNYASGVYLYKMTAHEFSGSSTGDYVNVKKMVIIK